MGGMKRLVVLAVLAAAAFGGATAPASADKICAQVDHTFHIPQTHPAPKLDKITVCVPLP